MLKENKHRDFKNNRIETASVIAEKMKNTEMMKVKMDNPVARFLG